MKKKKIRKSARPCQRRRERIGIAVSGAEDVRLHHH